jgi:hypothetical protein
LTGFVELVSEKVVLACRAGQTERANPVSVAESGRREPPHRENDDLAGCEAPLSESRDEGSDALSYLLRVVNVTLPHPKATEGICCLKHEAREPLRNMGCNGLGRAIVGSGSIADEAFSEQPLV